MALNKSQLLHQMRQEVGIHLVAIEDICKEYGLPLSNLTVIARDPNNDNMILVLTNESNESLKHATDLALAQRQVYP